MPGTSYVLLFTSLSLLALLGVSWSWRYGGYPPKPYRARPCQGRAWKEAFPAVDAEDMRRFLRVFASSFAFRESQKLQFAPQDEILSVYRAIYPRSGGVDALELESLTSAVKKVYGIELRRVWHENLALGELFAVCRAGPHAEK